MSERFAFASPAEALAALLPRIAPVGTERVELAQAGGRVLAEPIVADRPSPATDISAMDGYAVRAADAAASPRLPIAAHARIGREPPALTSGTAIHIVTGAPIPSGADAVIRREDVVESPQEIELLAPARAIKPGAAIRRRGDNANTGDQILGPGTQITPPIAGALASFGCARPMVHKRVRVAILTTGDEVVDAAETPSTWQLRDSNSPALAALFSSRAWCVVHRLPRILDDPASLERALTDALDDADALVATGGVSMGDRDYVPDAIRAVGAQVVFHRIPQRPGKPVLGAILPDGRPIFGLPGNPISVLVTARRMAAAALERLAGITTPPPVATVRIRDDNNRIDLWWHRLVRLIGAGQAELAGNTGSGDVPAAARSDGFAEIPPGSGGEGPWPFYPWAS
jgi:molybdopterin molybdotransferase